MYTLSTFSKDVNMFQIPHSVCSYLALYNKIAHIIRLTRWHLGIYLPPGKGLSNLVNKTIGCPIKFEF